MLRETEREQRQVVASDVRFSARFPLVEQGLFVQHGGMSTKRGNSILRGVDITERLILANGLGIVGLPLPACYTYAVNCGDGLVIVDPGLPEMHPRVMDNLARRGLAGMPVHAVFLTHGHGDHALAAGYWAKRGAPVYASAFAADQLNNNLVMAFKENPDYVRYSARYFPHLETAADGTVFRFGEIDFEVIYTPGHSPGCLTLAATIDGKHILFVGDLIFPDGSVGHVGEKSFRPRELLVSLESLAARPVDIFCGGHWYKDRRAERVIPHVLRRANKTLAAELADEAEP